MSRRIDLLDFFPRDAEDEHVLNLWDSSHRNGFTGLLFRFAKLHYAISAQKNGEGLEVLKQALAEWEGMMMESYLDVTDVVTKLHKGYGNRSDYYAAMSTLPTHTQNYRQLRAMFEAFLDDDSQWWNSNVTE